MKSFLQKTWLLVMITTLDAVVETSTLLGLISLTLVSLLTNASLTPLEMVLYLLVLPHVLMDLPTRNINVLNNLQLKAQLLMKSSQKSIKMDLWKLDLWFMMTS